MNQLQLVKFIYTKREGRALVKESFYARKAFFIDSGVGTSLVSEGEGEENDKADLDLSSEVPSM